ncbi:transposase [Streptomyces sp. Ac-502]|uniref:transposase n=1 Tax=Streptomyces sp. Ac-502 TaxID=3342801 RepID=UPI003862C75A
MTCPAGHTVPLGDPAGQHLQRKAFLAELCADCPLRPRCTTCKTGRILTIRPHHDEQAAARRQAVTDPDWQTAYRRRRPPAERGVAWLTAHGNRRLRYLGGTLKNDTWLHTRATALNLRRLINLGLTRTDGTWTLTPAPLTARGEPAPKPTPTSQHLQQTSSTATVLAVTGGQLGRWSGYGWGPC